MVKFKVNFRIVVKVIVRINVYGLRIKVRVSDMV